MTKKPIWAIQKESPQDSKLSDEKLLDSLTQRIFLPRMDFETLLDYYVLRAKPLEVRFGQPSHMGSYSEVDIGIKGPGTNKIGLYEKLLWNKLVYPPQNVLILVGGIGCGKTMSIQLICGITKDTPQHCPQQPKCKGKRLHILMDFNEVDYDKESDFDKACHEFMRDLSDRMSSNLYETLKPTERFEFIDFWNYEINRQHAEGGIEYAFSKIINEMQHMMGPNWEKSVDDDAIFIRREVFKEIEKDTALFLDYQCRFWRYILESVYEGKRQCVFAILDNIDCASPALQSAVRKVVISYQKRFNNTFVVCLRPETLLAKPVGVAANVVDIEPHCGPDPFDVVVDRLKKFIDNPKLFFRPKELHEELEKQIYELAKEIYRYLTDERNGKIIKDFIESLAGTNIRNALILATNLLKLRIEEHDFGPHELNRALISPPYRRYNRSVDNPVENIFHVEGSPDGRLLIKGRFLQFMRLGEQNTRTISDIVTMLENFGYKGDLICKACNEMMEPAHQLIISNSKVQYSLADFLSSENDEITLTYAGIGYAEKLIYDLDYISMVMPSCVVESSSFPVLPGHGLLRRFRTVIAFLNELNKVDYKETFDLKSLHSKEIYISNFGETMLMWEIIRNVCQSIWHVLYYLEGLPSSQYLSNIDFSTQMVEVYKDIANIMNVAAQNNKDVLGGTVEYGLPRPTSKKLRDMIGMIDLGEEH